MFQTTNQVIIIYKNGYYMSLYHEASDLRSALGI